MLRQRLRYQHNKVCTRLGQSDWTICSIYSFLFGILVIGSRDRSVCKTLMSVRLIPCVDHVCAWSWAKWNKMELFLTLLSSEHSWLIVKAFKFYQWKRTAVYLTKRKPMISDTLSLPKYGFSVEIWVNCWVYSKKLPEMMIFTCWESIKWQSGELDRFSGSLVRIFEHHH